MAKCGAQMKNAADLLPPFLGMFGRKDAEKIKDMGPTIVDMGLSDGGATIWNSYSNSRTCL